MSDDSIINGLVKDWDFEASPVARWERREMVETFLRTAHRRPSWCEIKKITLKSEWIVYFIYAPGGVLSQSQRFTLSRLRELAIPILVVCSCPDKNRIAHELLGFCDSLLWKDIAGYDFSAYTLALRYISRYSPGANVLVLNDSVFGPFSDLRKVLGENRWDLTGFTASSQITNHIQSYAFCLRNVSPSTMIRLSSVFLPVFAFSEARAVIRLQETRFARVAARSMRVGSYWFGRAEDVIDPTLARSTELLDAGFPFIKRSLLGKHKSFIDRDVVLTQLEQLGHPVD